MSSKKSKAEVKPEKTRNEIFISGLPYSTTEDEVREFFSGCGTIIEMKLPKFQDSGRLLGYGHVTFQDEEEARMALGKNGEYIGSRFIEVKLALEEKTVDKKTIAEKKKNIPENCKTVFIKGIPYDMNEDTLGDNFKQCGKIENVRIVYNSITKVSKGFGYIDFASPDSVVKALEMDGKLVGGRKITVDSEKGKAKEGYKLNMGDGNTKYANEKQQILKKKIKKEDKVTKKYVKIKDVNKKKVEAANKPKKNPVLNI